MRRRSKRLSSATSSVSASGALGTSSVAAVAAAAVVVAAFPFSVLFLLLVVDLPGDLDVHRAPLAGLLQREDLSYTISLLVFVHSFTHYSITIDCDSLEDCYSMYGR